MPQTTTLPGPSVGSRPVNGTLVLDGIPLVPRGPIQTEIINIMAPKVNIGEPGPDNHPINSSIIQSSAEGGGQIWKIVPASDMQRFWWSTLATEYPKYITLAPYTHDYNQPVGTTGMVLGDYPNDSTAKVYFSGGGRLFRYNSGTDGIDNLTALTAPVNKGMQYVPITGALAGLQLFYIPQGTQYQYWNGTVLSGVVSELALEFAVWDNKLFMLTTAGVLKWTQDGSTWTTVAQLTDGSQPRHLLNFMDRSDNPDLYVVTNHYTWALAFDSQTLIQTKLFFPRHPVAGLAATVHKGDLFAGAGLGLSQYNISTIAPVGLDHDQGLPTEYRGYYVDMDTSYNGLFALVKGQASGTAVTETETLDLGGGDPPMYDGAAAGSNSLLMVLTDEGWHYRWAGVGSTPTNVFVSQADGTYKVWWAAGGQFHSQFLPFTYFNPRDPSTAGIEFAADGEFETGWHDWGWQGQQKILKRFEFGVEQASATEKIEVYFKVDDDANAWIHVGDLTASSNRTIFNLGLDIDNPLLPDGNPRYQGIKHERFRLRLRFSRGTDRTQKPVLSWWAAIGRKLPAPQRSWRFTVDLTKKMRDRPPGYLTTLVEALPSKGYAVPFLYGSKSYMVDVVAISGPDDFWTEKEDMSYRTIHLLEANEMDVAPIVTTDV